MGGNNFLFFACAINFSPEFKDRDHQIWSLEDEPSQMVLLGWLILEGPHPQEIVMIIKWRNKIFGQPCLSNHLSWVGVIWSGPHQGKCNISIMSFTWTWWKVWPAAFADVLGALVWWRQHVMPSAGLKGSASAWLDRALLSYDLWIRWLLYSSQYNFHIEFLSARPVPLI